MRYLRRHPKSGHYEFFGAAPGELKAVIGQTMVRRSLGGAEWTADTEQRFYTTAREVAARLEGARRSLRAKKDQENWEHIEAFFEHTWPKPKLALGFKQPREDLLREKTLLKQERAQERLR